MGSRLGELYEHSPYVVSVTPNVSVRTGAWRRVERGNSVKRHSYTPPLRQLCLAPTAQCAPSLWPALPPIEWWSCDDAVARSTRIPTNRESGAQTRSGHERGKGRGWRRMPPRALPSAMTATARPTPTRAIPNERFPFKKDAYSRGGRMGRSLERVSSLDEYHVGPSLET